MCIARRVTQLAIAAILLLKHSNALEKYDQDVNPRTLVAYDAIQTKGRTTTEKTKPPNIYCCIRAKDIEIS